MRRGKLRQTATIQAEDRFMLILVPVMLASGLIAALVAASSVLPGGEARTDVLLSNMMLAHRGAIGVASQSGFAPGPVAPALPWPFMDVGGWRSLIVADDNRLLLLTWPSAGDQPAQAGRMASRALADYSLPGRSGGRPLWHFAGAAEVSEDGAVGVGGNDLPSLDVSIAAGVPVIGTWVLP